jgi:hypothetical protein
MDIINSSLLDVVKNLTKPRSPFPYRRLGYLMLEGIIKGKKNEAWDHPGYKTLVYSMVKDSELRIRRQFCQFTYRLFEPLREFQVLQNQGFVYAEEIAATQIHT